MKPIFVLFASVTLTVFVNGQINDRPNAKYLMECAQSSGAPTEDLLKLKEGQVIDEPNVKKFIGCAMRKLGIQDDKGKMIEQTIKTQLASLSIKKDDIESLIKKCLNIKGGNMNETAYQVLKCFAETNPEFLKFI